MINRGLLIILLIFLPVLGGCSDLFFYWQAASGHLGLLNHKKDIHELLENPQTDSKLKSKLLLVEEVLKYASTNLSLPINTGYSSYVELDRPYVTVVILAAPELGLKPHQWCYWFIGCQEYRGYFDINEAKDYVSEMDKSLDVSIRPVSAYSTLGWLNQPWLPDYFSDPLLSTFIKSRESDIIATLIHEMAHQIVYVEGDTAFNESFAVFVEEQGVLNFYKNYEDKVKKDYLWYLSSKRDQERFRQMILEVYWKLDDLYKAELPDREKRENKKEIFKVLKQKFSENKALFEVRHYQQWFEQDLNNTHILSVRRYHRDTKAFHKLFESVGKQWKTFFTKVKALAKEPYENRIAFLNQDK